MSLCVRKMLLNSVKVCSYYCKLFSGIACFLDKMYFYSHL